MNAPSRAAVIPLEDSPAFPRAPRTLEETGLPYEPHLVRFDQKEQLSPEFRSLNPYAKIPAIIDPLGPNSEPLALFESAAILIYLADKSGKFLAAGGAARYETLQWVMFQTANISPIFGQLGFFHKFEGKTYEDKRPRDRYAAESRRLLDVVEAHGPILIEGPFATNRTYVAALAALRPQSEVRPSHDAHGTSLGAAMLVEPDMALDMPAAVPAPTLDLGLYRARWRTFIGARRLLAGEIQLFN